MLQYHLESLILASRVNDWVVATTFEPGSEEIIAMADFFKLKSYQGSLEDVLDRYYQAAKRENPDYVVRVTSDCPLIDPILIDSVVKFTIDNALAYSVTSSKYPDGVDVEVFRFEELEEAWKYSGISSEREHVTPYIRKKVKEQQELMEFPCAADFSFIRMTVDEADDLAAISTLIENVGEKRSWMEYAGYILSNGKLFKNQQIVRNSGYNKSLKNDTTQKY